MRPASATIAIDAPRERVFDLLVDLSLRPSFTDHFLSEYRLERLEPIGTGAAARYRTREGGQWLDGVIAVAERPHLIREHGRGGRSNRVPAFTIWELAEGPAPGSCEATVTFWTEPTKRIDRLRELGHHRRFRRDWRRALRRLREIVERGDAVERVGVGGGDAAPAFAR